MQRRSHYSQMNAEPIRIEERSHSENELGVLTGNARLQLIQKSLFFSSLCMRIYNRNVLNKSSRVGTIYGVMCWTQSWRINKKRNSNLFPGSQHLWV